MKNTTTPSNITTILEKERYNESSIAELEKYVDFQIEDNSFDLEANLALLKLYQFNPNRINEQVLINILIKALMRLPTTDFQLCLYLVTPEQMVCTPNSFLELNGNC